MGLGCCKGMGMRITVFANMGLRIASYWYWMIGLRITDYTCMGLRMSWYEVENIDRCCFHIGLSMRMKLYLGMGLRIYKWNK